MSSVLDEILRSAQELRERKNREAEDEYRRLVSRGRLELENKVRSVFGPLWDELEPYATLEEGLFPSFKINHPKLYSFEVVVVGKSLRIRDVSGPLWTGNSMDDVQLHDVLLDLAMED